MENQLQGGTGQSQVRAPASVSFCINGDPRPLTRPRMTFSRHLNRAWMRDTAGNIQAKAAFRRSVPSRVFVGGTPAILFDAETPIVVDVTFLMARPLIHFVNPRVTGRDRLRDASRVLWPRRSDIDNLDKLVLDALQGFLFANDTQVVKQHIQKIYHNSAPYTGQTVVSIRPAVAYDLIPMAHGMIAHGDGTAAMPFEIV